MKKCGFREGVGHAGCMKLQKKDEGADQNTNRESYGEKEERQKKGKVWKSDKERENMTK